MAVSKDHVCTSMLAYEHASGVLRFCMVFGITHHSSEFRAGSHSAPEPLDSNLQRLSYVIEQRPTTSNWAALCFSL